MLCRKLNLFADAFVAIDGSKFKAVYGFPETSAMSAKVVSGYESCIWPSEVCRVTTTVS
jgi:hypothetical protein